VRVLWITPGFAGHETDFNCIPPQQLLARALLRRGVDLQIITLEYPFRAEPYDWYGARVYPCDGRNRRWLKARTLWRAASIADALSGQAGSRPDAIHSFWLGWCSALGERLAKRSGIPHYTTLMGQDVLPQNRRSMLWLNAERSRRLIAVSDFQNAVFEKNAGYRAARVIPWGIDAADIPTALPAERPVDVLGAGSLVPVKNWEKWLRTIALLVRENPGLRAEIAGNGVDRSTLEACSRRLGVEGQVHFAGELPRAEVLARMRQSRVLLHTAHYESFGYVLAEAAACGCRIVGTPVGATGTFGKTADNEAGLAALVAQALREPLANQSFVPCTMEDTAREYEGVYGGR
jgi:glycosyltransferase involved in cell wall biosynthesis